MKCPDIHDRLGAYLDGELNPAEAEVVREHLAKCRRCARVLEEHRRLDQLLDSQEGISAPPDFVARVRSAAEKRAEPVKLFAAEGTWNRTLFRVAALLVLAIGLGFGLVAGNSVSRPESETTRDADRVAVDPLSAAPGRSLADLYLAMIDQSGLNGEDNAQ